MSTEAAPGPWDDLNDIAIDNVRAEVARRRLSLRGAAFAMGMSHQRLSDKMNGRSRLTLNDVGRFAAFLGVEPAELLVRHLGLEPRTR
jgi:transcriptional regulator with XRE-family HTH domain